MFAEDYKYIQEFVKYYFGAKRKYTVCDRKYNLFILTVTELKHKNFCSIWILVNVQSRVQRMK